MVVDIPMTDEVLTDLIFVQYLRFKIKYVQRFQDFNIYPSSSQSPGYFQIHDSGRFFRGS